MDQSVYLSTYYLSIRINNSQYQDLSDCKSIETLNVRATVRRVQSLKFIVLFWKSHSLCDEVARFFHCPEVRSIKTVLQYTAARSTQDFYALPGVHSITMKCQQITRDSGTESLFTTPILCDHFLINKKAMQACAFDVSAQLTEITPWFDFQHDCKFSMSELEKLLPCCTSIEINLPFLFYVSSRANHQICKTLKIKCNLYTSNIFLMTENRNAASRKFPLKITAVITV